MIDYEKLKAAIEIAQASDKYWFSIEFAFSTLSFKIEIILHSIDREPIEIDSLDDLLAKLQELTKPEPKFKAGDVVWYAEDLHIYNFEVESYSQGKNINGWMYTGTDDMMSEAYLYASRQELIQAQIDHWQSLKEADVESNQVQVDVDSCQHRIAESAYMIINGKCVKCVGEIYR